MEHNPPYGREVRIRIGGPAGFGVKAAGQTLARVFTRAGYNTIDLTEYPSLIKGGHNTYHLRVSEDEIFSHVMATDILVALDRTTVTAHLAELTPHGAIVYDPHDIELTSAQLGREDLCLVAVPLNDIVREVKGMPIMRNVAALGAVLGHMDFPLDGLIGSLKAQFAKKPPEVAEQNIAVATRASEYARENACEFPYRLGPVLNPSPSILVDGNEAVGLGALAAGIGLYCAYPMTPASTLLHFMASHADSAGVVVKHTEDEIAAMNMVVGGAFGGTRSMCATSGGGFSLMVEALGFAGVSESAVVVGLFTRPGPATGLPTWTEQSDVRFAIHAAQGEFPRVVLAPGDRADAFELTWRAFNLADQLQTPVILLGDSYLSDNRESLPELDTAAVHIERGELQTEGEVTDYLRYRVTESGVSPRAIPGVIGAEQIVNSYEHDEHGWGAIGEDAAIRVAQNEKRLRKLDLARELVPPPAHFGPKEADVSIILFGTSKMPAREAMRWLEADGVRVNMLQLVTVWPFPTDAVSAFLGSATRSLVVEGNATGQLEGLIRQYCLAEPGHRLNRYDGRPISPEMIYVMVHRILGNRIELTPAGALVSKIGGAK